MFNNNGKNRYNQQMMNRAYTAVTLRIVVAGYIIFIAVNLIKGSGSETSSIPSWAGILIGALFIAAAAGFIIYALRTFFKARKEAMLDSDDLPKEEKQPETPMSIEEKVRKAQAMLESERKEK